MYFVRSTKGSLESASGCSYFSTSAGIAVVSAYLGARVDVDSAVEDIDCDAFDGNTGVGPEVPELLTTELAPTSVLVEVEVPDGGVDSDEI